MAKLHKSGRFIGSNKIGANSLSVVDGDLITNVGGFADKADAGEKIIGIAAGEQTFASDNQTVDQVELQYIELDDYTVLEIAADAAITQADEGKYYNINTTTQTVDVATASTVARTVDASSVSTTEPVVELQVQLYRFVDQNTSLYKVVR